MWVITQEGSGEVLGFKGQSDEDIRRHCEARHGWFRRNPDGSYKLEYDVPQERPTGPVFQSPYCYLPGYLETSDSCNAHLRGTDG